MRINDKKRVVFFLFWLEMKEEEKKKPTNKIDDEWRTGARDKRQIYQRVFFSLGILVSIAWTACISIFGAKLPSDPMDLVYFCQWRNSYSTDGTEMSSRPRGILTTFVFLLFIHAKNDRIKCCSNSTFFVLHIPMDNG